MGYCIHIPAPGYIRIIHDAIAHGVLKDGDVNQIGKILADHFEIVMQYVGGILERMKDCFKDEKDMKDISNQVAARSLSVEAVLNSMSCLKNKPKFLRK
ncbi:hypothetical protein DdX_14306 [Ditylenchus destructor]|uniref:Uncharacterized protein n=1 Tax=Ditylenchus destructor TaxID=166010 RepID=A0AAD4MUE5_9BILA|nr:hypothetical protein DdX_14306 [Ditylenchus destructor]